MTHAHTPGPFPLHIQHDGERYAIITAQGNHFATTHDPSAARLIAVAPVLLEAVQAMVDAFGDQDSILIDQCKAALSKAERGEA